MSLHLGLHDLFLEHLKKEEGSCYERSALELDRWSLFGGEMRRWERASSRPLASRSPVGESHRFFYIARSC